MNKPFLILLSVWSLAAAPYSSASGNDHEQFAKQCLGTGAPQACMESHGFSCDKFRLPDRSIEAFLISCNLHLNDGRAHFVQLLFDQGGWSIDTQHSYVPEPVLPDDGIRDSQEALRSYVAGQMEKYLFHSGGPEVSALFPGLIEIQTGARFERAALTVRAICAVVDDGTPTKLLEKGIRERCEYRLLRAVKKLSQSQLEGPYRVAGPSEIKWQTLHTFMATGDALFVVEGYVSRRNSWKPCIWMSDCCSSEGSFYLDSCRTPSAEDMLAIENCLNVGFKRRSAEFIACLQNQRVKVGCTEQPDGSQLCY